MTGDEQERFEDYLELERYIEELQAGHVAHPPTNLTPSQANIYRMAALFRSLSPEAASPRPEFAEQLEARLLHAAEQQEATQEVPALGKPVEQEKMSTPQEQGQREVQHPLPQKSGLPKRARFVSRRSLLTGGAVAAASLMAGAALGATAEQLGRQGAQTPTKPPPSSYDTATPLVPADASTTWQFVTTLAQLGEGAVRFVSEVVIGYVIRNDGDDGEQDPSLHPVIAVSAACTHMGCLVQWSNSDRHFHCPCHGGLFTEYGKPANSGPLRYLAALPRLNVKIEDGKVYVEVPKNTA
jgi:Rieske Fe-S protein